MVLTGGRRAAEIDEQMRCLCEHRDTPADHGFTIVELVVALTVLALGIVGVVGVTNSSFRVAAGASARSKMVAATTQEIEKLRAVPFDKLPVGYSEAAGSAGGIAYDVQRTVTTAPGGERYREAIVSITWTDATGPHEVHQKTYLYPGGLGPTGSTPTTAPPGGCTPATPTDLAVARAADLATMQATNTVDVTWTASTGTCVPEGYVIQYREATAALYNEIDGLATTAGYRVTGLTAGTTYAFRIAARGPSGNLSPWSGTVSVATAVATSPPCSFGPITLTPAEVTKASASPTADLVSNLAIALPANGSCEAYDVVYRKLTTGPSTSVPMSLVNGTFVATIAKLGPWDVGGRYVDVVHRSNRVKVATVLLTVCEHNARSCG